MCSTPSLMWTSSTPSSYYCSSPDTVLSTGPSAILCCPASASTPVAVVYQDDPSLCLLCSCPWMMMPTFSALKPAQARLSITPPSTEARLDQLGPWPSQQSWRLPSAKSIISSNLELSTHLVLNGYLSCTWSTNQMVNGNRVAITAI